MNTLAGLFAGLMALAVPILAVVSFIMLMMKWDEWGTSRCLPLVLVWAAIFTGIAVL